VNQAETLRLLGPDLPVLREDKEFSAPQLQQVKAQLHTLQQNSITCVTQATHELWLHLEAGLRKDSGAGCGNWSATIPCCTIDFVHACKQSFSTDVAWSWSADIIETAVIPTVSCATHQAKADVEKQVLAQRPLVAALQHTVQ
jgi:hypothetical protein